MSEGTFHRLSREALHKAVWSEPMRVLAPRLGVSDVALAKACRRAAVPVPERGFWAKRKAGARTEIPKLPARPFGLPDEVVIGRGNSWHWDRGLTEAELREPIPAPPVFAEDLDQVRQRAADIVDKVPAREKETHRAIQSLLDEDEARREAQRKSSYPVWDKPRYDTPIERRRLKIVSLLFNRLERCGAAPSLRNNRYDPISFSVRVGHEDVAFELEPISGRGKRGDTGERRPERLRFKIKTWPGRDDARAIWEDDDQGRIEGRLTAIAVEVLVSGEIEYREGVLANHRWRIERKRAMEQEARRKKEEAERRERERQAAIQKARVERLLAEADALRCAREIRTYVDEVRVENDRSSNPVAKEDVEAWAAWALHQADLVDPVRSRAFLEGQRIGSG